MIIHDSPGVQIASTDFKVSFNVLGGCEYCVVGTDEN
jgi:hypothetical protein